MFGSCIFSIVFCFFFLLFIIFSLIFNSFLRTNSYSNALKFIKKFLKKENKKYELIIFKVSNKLTKNEREFFKKYFDKPIKRGQGIFLISIGKNNEKDLNENEDNKEDEIENEIILKRRSIFNILEPPKQFLDDIKNKKPTTIAPNKEKKDELFYIRPPSIKELELNEEPKKEKVFDLEKKKVVE